MSLTLESPPSSPASSAPPSRSRGALWARVGLAVALAAASGAVRARQVARLESEQLSGWVSPFPLDDIPLELGPWEGHSETLDPTIARGTGAVDNMFRVYTDRRTGTRISVIALYGPSTAVSIHAPELCYPVSGYRQVGPTRVRKVTADDVPVRSLTYVKGEGGAPSVSRSITPGITTDGGRPPSPCASGSSGSRPCTSSTWPAPWPRPSSSTARTRART